MSIANASLPRVSTILQILDDAYVGVPAKALAKAAERGESLHQLCLTYLASLAGQCEPPTVPDEFINAYTSFCQWCTEHQVEPIAIEQYSVSEKHGYCGTPDALVLFGQDRLLLLIDLKFTASILRLNRVQVQAYWRLEGYEDAKKALLLHIAPVTGKLTPHFIPKNPHDWAGFLNALSVWKWRRA